MDVFFQFIPYLVYVLNNEGKINEYPLLNHDFTNISLFICPLRNRTLESKKADQVRVGQYTEGSESSNFHLQLWNSSTPTF